MGKDYYQILGISREANEQDIKKAYRKLAVEWHPDKHSGDDQKEAEERFLKISEAYEVLSDKNKKQIYDQYGEQGLKSGSHGQPAFNFSPQNAQNLFNMFVGGFGMGKNLFMGTPLAGAFGNTGASFVFGPDVFIQRRDRPVVRELNLTLEQLYQGTVKKLRLTRMEFEESSKELKKVPHVIEIKIQPGWSDGTKINFEKMGDRYPGRIPADVIFVVKELPHRYFQRIGDDLIYKITISLKKALVGCKIVVPTLNPLVPSLDVDCREDVIETGFQKIIKGYGMPVVEQSRQRHSGEEKSTSLDHQSSNGDLIIEFQVEFPTTLSTSQRQKLDKIL